MGGPGTSARAWQIITRTIVFLLMGAVVNVAVAWGCAFVADFRSAPERLILVKRPPAQWYISTAQRSTFGATQSIRRALLPTSYGVSGDMQTLTFDESAQPTVMLKPGETIEREGFERLPNGLTGPWSSTFMAIEPWMNSSGWPMRSMCCWLENLSGYPSNNVAAWRGKVTLAWGWNPRMDKLDRDANVLPLRPLWPGFAINTMFYAAILWMLFVIPGVLCRKRRIKRGLCPACAYPVGASDVCTECGQLLVAKRAHPSEQMNRD